MEYATGANAGFFRESHLRANFTDWLLRDLSARRRLFDEVEVRKSGETVGFVDNVIIVNGRLVPVEIKLNIAKDTRLAEQIAKYSSAESLIHGGRDLGAPGHDAVLVADSDGIYLARDGRLAKGQEPLLLREATTPSAIRGVRQAIVGALQ